MLYRRALTQINFRTEFAGPGEMDDVLHPGALGHL